MNHIYAIILAIMLITPLSAPGDLNRARADEHYLVSPVVDYGTARFNNENWFTLPHPKVAEFTIREDGSAYGLTENGIPFYQYIVPNSVGIRVQRFEIQDHYHYIVEGEIAYSLGDLSARLALAYLARNV